MNIQGKNRDWVLEGQNLFLIIKTAEEKFAGTLDEIKQGKHHLSGWSSFEPFDDVAHVLFVEETAAIAAEEAKLQAIKAAREADKAYKAAMMELGIALSDSYKGDKKAACLALAQKAKPYASPRLTEWDGTHQPTDLQRKLVERAANDAQIYSPHYYHATQTMAWCANGAFAHAIAQWAMFRGVDGVMTFMSLEL